MDKDTRIKELEEENEKLKEHLKKYTAPSYKKAYYEKNKEQILEKNKIKSSIARKTKRICKTSIFKKERKNEGCSKK